MQNGWMEHIVTWIGAHPVAAGGLIFLIAFCDAVAVVGIVVPALPLLFAVGTLIGLGYLNGPYALICAALGAFAGDALSYWIGYRWGPAMREHWLFRRYPQFIDRGERLFKRHGSKGIVMARFVGAVRPFVPAVAGMLRLPLKRYAPASLFAALAWAGVFLAPGWIFGTSYDAVAAVADRLALVLLALIAVLALVWACVLYTYRWFARHADRLLARTLKWTRDHPRLGRYAASLIQPHRPESASLAMLAMCLIGIGWAWFALLATVLAHGGPLGLDFRVQAAMHTLRNPLADHMMAALASLSDAPVLIPPLMLAMSWLLWRRRFAAALHWLTAIGFGLLFTAIVGLSIDMPRPSAIHSTFNFSSIPITLLTILFGFFAVLIARELPGKQRVWPYLLTGVVVSLEGFAQLYFGSHWLSDIIGSMLFGIVWLLVIGIAYRRHIERSFWMRPLGWIFYGSFALMAMWYTPRAITPLLTQFSPPAPGSVLNITQWWNGGWAELPLQRDERSFNARDTHSSTVNDRSLLDIQIAGPLAALQTRLQSDHWQPQSQASWVSALGLLDPKRSPSQQPVLPATFDTQAEALLLRKQGPQPDILYVLRVWRAPAVLESGEPLWVGSTQTLRYRRTLHLLGLWMPEAEDARAAHRRLRDSLQGLTVAESMHPRSHAQVLRIQSDPSSAERLNENSTD